MSFNKVIENFQCAHCGFVVSGDGYTNHCPKCLWSKHVDNNPGDRSNNCEGMLEPIGIETKSGEFVIIHKCQKCKDALRCKSSPTDNYDEIIYLSQNPVSA